MLKRLGHELLSAPPPPATQVETESEGLFSIFTKNMLTQAFSSTDTAGNPYTTISFSPSETTVVPKSAAPTQTEAFNLASRLAAVNTPALKPGNASTPEQSMETFDKFVGGVVTGIWAPFANILNTLAVKADLIPTVPEILGEDVQRLNQAAQEFTSNHDAFLQEAQTQNAIDATKNYVMAAVGFTRSFSNSTQVRPATPEENRLANAQVRDVLSKAIKDMGGLSCPHCHQFPCQCGAFPIEKYLAQIPDTAGETATQHNTDLAKNRILEVFDQQANAHAASKLQAAHKEKLQLELLHLTPKQMLVAALLSDWTQIPMAIGSAIIPNEAGKKGVSVILNTQPRDFGGNSLIVSAGSPGGGTEEGRGIPMNYVTKWEQPDWQQFASDHPRMRRWWAKHGDGTIPEIGKLTVASPAAPDKVKAVFPLAVRLPAKDKPATGGAAVLPLAIQAMLAIQEAATKLSASATTHSTNLADTVMLARSNAEKAIEQDGVRAPAIAQIASTALRNMAHDKDATTNYSKLLHYVAHETGIPLQPTAEADAERRRIAELALAADNFRSASANRDRAERVVIRKKHSFVNVGTPQQPNFIPTKDFEATNGNVLDWSSSKLAENAAYLLNLLNNDALPPELVTFDRATLARALAYHNAHHSAPAEPPKKETTKKRSLFGRKK